MSEPESFLINLMSVVITIGIVYSFLHVHRDQMANEAEMNRLHEREMQRITDAASETQRPPIVRTGRRQRKYLR